MNKIVSGVVNVAENYNVVTKKAKLLSKKFDKESKVIVDLKNQLISISSKFKDENIILDAIKSIDETVNKMSKVITTLSYGDLK